MISSPLLQAHDLRRETSHGNPHATARIHIHTGWRVGFLAACGARAAAADAGDWVSQPRIARTYAINVGAFRQGLKEAGYIDGQNVMIEYRWAEGQYDRLPAMAVELVRRQVTVIAATSTPAALVAQKSTMKIPIVFTTSSDPVHLGLVASLNRPGGNLTGFTQLNVEVAPKRVELLHELVPTATTIALLVNPTNPNVETVTRDLQAAVQNRRLRSHVLHASNEHEIDSAFATLDRLRADGRRNRFRRILQYAD